MTIREIITEALSRANLCPRKREAPGDLLESANRLLKGIIQKYNFSNFISYTREKMTIVVTENPVIVNASSIATVSYKLSDVSNTPMRFVSFEQFDETNDLYVYTWHYNDDNQIEIDFKKQFVERNPSVTIVYNTELNYDLNDTVHIPQVYVELFTTALTYKLAMTYPRTDATQVTLLKNELDEIEKTVKSLVASNKILTRETSSVSNLANFISGNFIFR